MKTENLVNALKKEFPVDYLSINTVNPNRISVSFYKHYRPEVLNWIEEHQGHFDSGLYEMWTMILMSTVNVMKVIFEYDAEFSDILRAEKSE